MLPVKKYKNEESEKYQVDARNWFSSNTNDWSYCLVVPVLWEQRSGLISLDLHRFDNRWGWHIWLLYKWIEDSHKVAMIISVYKSSNNWKSPCVNHKVTFNFLTDRLPLSTDMLSTDLHLVRISWPWKACCVTKLCLFMCLIKFTYNQGIKAF